jgi:hypothetical protein
MKSKGDENFHTTKLWSDVEDVHSNEKYTGVANSFHNTFLLYLEKLSKNGFPLNMCHWTLLKNAVLGRKSCIVQSILPVLTKV